MKFKNPFLSNQRSIESYKEELKSYETELTRVRPIAECYERALKKFGLEKNLIAYVCGLQENQRRNKELLVKINEFLLEVAGKIPYEKRKIKGYYQRQEAAELLQQDLEKELKELKDAI